VLGLLESFIGENGQSGLQILLSAWCDNAETFIGNWATRIRFVQTCLPWSLSDNTVREVMLR
jgi:hypothetical protein